VRTVGQLGLMFRRPIDDVSGQVLNMQTATSEIAQGTSDLNACTEQAAASVEQTATVKSNADTTHQANRLSGSACEAAAQGGAKYSHSPFQASGR